MKRAHRTTKTTPSKTPGEDLDHKLYRKELRLLQVELVKLQRHLIKHDHKVLVIFEGRDASGKDGVIKRIVQHLSPRETRVVALGKPTERERESWYFQRYVAQLPVQGEMVLMNRSWYNRAGVERVFGFCTATEYDAFFDTVNDFERILVRSGVQIVKYYLDISKPEQRTRLRDRRRNPLKQWKLSPIDEQALDRWKEYSEARNAMLQRTHSDHSPWTIVRADQKRQARLNVIRDILRKVECPDRDEHISKPDKRLVFPFRQELIDTPAIAS